MSQRTLNILTGLFLVLFGFGLLQIRDGLVRLDYEVASLEGVVYHQNQQLDLAVLDSCGVITNGRVYGSCVVIEPNLVLTAGHCIDLADSRIEIGGVRYEIKSKRRSSRYDVGFVVIDGDVPFIPLGDNPAVQDKIYIVGTPHIESFENVISAGIVCKTKLVYSRIDLDLDWMGCFISDSMAGPGNSGGPVLDNRGRIVGIYVGLWSGTDNFSVCVPASQIKEALKEYKNDEAEVQTRS